MVAARSDCLVSKALVDPRHLIPDIPSLPWNHSLDGEWWQPGVTAKASKALVDPRHLIPDIPSLPWNHSLDGEWWQPGVTAGASSC